MKNIQKLIIEVEGRKKLHEQNYRNGKINYSNWQGRKTECNFFIQSLNLLLNEQPEAITDDAQFRKHDVSGSAESEEISDASDPCSAPSSETATVSGNEQTKEVCQRCNGLGWIRLMNGGHKQCEECLQANRLDASASEP